MKSVRLVRYKRCIVGICGTGEFLAGNVTTLMMKDDDEDDNRACVKYGESVP